MKSMEIYYSDLTTEAQARFLKFQGLDDAEDGNFEYSPITIVDSEEEEDVT